MTKTMKLIFGALLVLFFVALIWGIVSIRNNRSKNAAQNTVTTNTQNNEVNNTAATGSSNQSAPAAPSQPAATAPATTSAKAPATKTTKRVVKTYYYPQEVSASASASAGVDAHGNAWASATAY